MMVMVFDHVPDDDGDVDDNTPMAQYVDSCVILSGGHSRFRADRADF